MKIKFSAVILGLLMALTSIVPMGAPLTVAASNATAVQIAAGENHTLVRLNNNEVWAFGANNRGQLGLDNNFQNVSQPTRVPLPSGTVSYIAAGGNTSYAIVGGQLVAWGDNAHGQLGVAVNATTDARRSQPAVVDTISGTVSQVSAGNGHALVRTGNTLWFMGRNHQGQGSLHYTQETVSTPTVVDTHGVTITNIAANGHHSLLLDAYGRLWGAGANQSGQISRPHDRSNQFAHFTTGGQIEQFSSGTSTIAAGSNFTLLLNDGRIYAYGRDNEHGRVGRSGAGTDTGVVSNRANRGDGGDWLNRSSSMPNASSTGITAIAAGTAHSLAVNTDGHVFAWGLNSNGQLGNGNTQSTSTGEDFRLVRAGDMSNMTQVAAGAAHSVARGTNGSVWTWGLNSSGQLGDGHTSNRNTPVQILNANGTWTNPGTNQQPGTNINDFTFQLAGGGYTITGFTGTVPAGGAIVFPNVGPSGTTVRTIASTVFVGMNHAQRDNITTLSFQSPSSVTHINANAFFNMPGLRNVILPASIERIGSAAFANNLHLAEVHFQHPNGLTLRQGQVFEDASIFQGVGESLRLTRPAGSNADTYVPFISPVGTSRNWTMAEANAAWWTVTPATGTGPVTITGFTGPTTTTTLVIPATIAGRSVIGIGTNAINQVNAPNLVDITIPQTVHTLAANAIVGTNLTTVRLQHPDANMLQVIPANAFGPADLRHTNFRLVFPTQSTGFTVPTWQGFPTHSDTGGNWEYSEWTGQGLIVTGYTGNSTAVQIPESIGGRPVRYIGPNLFTSNAHIREVAIPASVVFISDNAFNSSPNLEVIYLAHTSADAFDFFPTTAIRGVHPDFRIYFPATSTGFTTPEWNGHPAYPQRWEYTVAGGIATITGFSGYEAEVVIPSSIGGFPVRVIATETFVNNATITSILIPASVTTIEHNAVFNCRNLTTAIFEHTNAATITNFAAYAFVGVANNFRILFPVNATGFTTPVWGRYFAEPHTGATILTHGYFEYTIRRVTLPDTGDISRDEVVITRYLGTGTTVTIPAAIAGIPVAGLGDALFFHNTAVTAVNLPASLRTIGNNTFTGATGLTSIELPASVVSIGASAFTGATSLVRVQLNNTNAADITFGASTFANTADNFHISFPAGAEGFTTPTWRNLPAVPHGQAPSTPPNNQQPSQPTEPTDPTDSTDPTTPPNNQQPQQPAAPRSFPVRTTDSFPGVTGQPIMFRDGVGYVSLRAFAILIESDPATQIQFNQPITGWATVIGRHTNGSTVTLSVTSNDPRVAVTVSGVQHAESDLAAWAGPLSGRTRGNLRTRNEGGNIFLPFRAVSNIFGYDVEMLDSNTVQFTALTPSQG